MNGNLVVIGLNHRTAPVELRERLCFAATENRCPLSGQMQLPGVPESVLFTTCNRTEMIALLEDIRQGTDTIIQFFADYNAIARSEFEHNLYVFTREDAVRHLFRLASGLDSMVLGEPQIAGQVKDAYRKAVEHKTTGMVLNHLFHKAFTTAKRVRTETQIAANAVSISFAAVELAKKIFEDLSDRAIMLVGAGEMSELTARHLMSNGVRTICIANRSHETAVCLAEKFQGIPIPFSETIYNLNAVDIVITSTGAPHCIITYPAVKKTLRDRRNHPMFFIDIAVPRDVDPLINTLDNVYLYNIDDLQGVVDDNMGQRQKEAEKAEVIVREEVDKFMVWLATQDAVPTIVSLKAKLDKIRKSEMEKALASLGQVGERERRILDILTSSIVNKIAHDPIVYLKRGCHQEGEDAYAIDVTRKLFRLDGKTPDEPECKK
ncbi:MAG: glutamyl-tRNA reductase [Deltaproteobacteria bacterium]|nr:glutamyl-tRNA reductase [Deltaproteobacteria bacterium]MBW2306865.1 glutamyl-tRNA reductase [Deltaproteobacteria bacterium]